MPPAKRIIGPREPKPLNVPGWANEHTLIGYTCKNPIPPRATTPEAIANFVMNSDSEALPSVYYQVGHATLDHALPNNIGWEGDTDWKRLFFGNVPLGYYAAIDEIRKRRLHTAFASAFDEPPNPVLAERTEKRHPSLKKLTDELRKFSIYDPKARQWNQHRARETEAPRFLLEVFATGHGYFFHPSRNRFRWVADNPQLKMNLHGLATRQDFMAHIRGFQQKAATPKRPH